MSPTYCISTRNDVQQRGSPVPVPLLPVSFGHAKDWILRQQRAQSRPIQEGIVNESAREVVSELNRSLAKQPPSAATLLQQPPRVASPVIPAPTMSLGPDQVTSQEKAAERQEQQSRKRQQQEVAGPSGLKPPSKKKSVADPELQERQKRAADRMVELGVSPHQVSIHFLKPALYRLIVFHFYV